MDKPDNLTGKQWLFCLAYAEMAHITNAAIAAGYSKKTALSIGSENLRKPHIQEALAELWKQNTMTAEEVLSGVASMARFSEDERVRLKAYELIGKSGGGMWTDKQTTSGDMTINVTIGDDDD